MFKVKLGNWKIAIMGKIWHAWIKKVYLCIWFGWICFLHHFQIYLIVLLSNVHAARRQRAKLIYWNLTIVSLRRAKWLYLHKSDDCLFKESKMVALKSSYCFFKMRIIYRTSLDRIYNQRFRKIFILNVINMLFFIFCNCCRSIIQKYVCYTI